MGIIRKTIASTLAVSTGGASLAFVQFRSDTERSTRQTKLLRLEQERAIHLGEQQLHEAQKQRALSDLERRRNDAIQASASVRTRSHDQVARAVDAPRSETTSGGGGTETVSVPEKVADALERLYALKLKGLLSDSEYAEKKVELLRDLRKHLSTTA